MPTNREKFEKVVKSEGKVIPYADSEKFTPTCVICKVKTGKVMMDHPDGDGIEECWYRGYPDKGMWIELKAEEGQEGVTAFLEKRSPNWYNYQM